MNCDAELVEPDVDRPDLRAERCVELERGLLHLRRRHIGRPAQETNADFVHGQRAEASADRDRRRDDRRADVSRTAKRRRWSGAATDAPFEHQPARRRIANGDVEPQV